MRPSVQWIVTTLQTAKTEHLQRITILARLRFDVFVETGRPEWQELDHLLVRLWTSRSIIPSIKYFRAQKRTDSVELIPSLLPELATRGAVWEVGSSRN